MSGRTSVGAGAVGAFASLLVATVGAPRGRGPEEASSPRLDRHQARPVDAPLQMSVVTKVRGHGPAAREGDRVRVRYTGKPPSASVPAEGHDPRSPFDFVLGGWEVIEGWDEALVGMKAGEKRALVIPPALAYGARGREGVAPGETLFYEVELLALLGEDHDD